MFINKITSLMLDQFVDYLKKEKVTKKIKLNKDERIKDMSKISLVSPAPFISIVDNDEIEYNTSSDYSEKSTVLGNSQNAEEKQKEQPNEKNKNQNKLEEGEALVGRVYSEKTQNAMKDTDNEKAKEDEKKYMFFESESFDVNVDALFKNGNRYQGRLSCYLMEGEATYKWSDGTTYKGTFTDGIAGGLVNIKWPDGSWYDGEMKRNRRHGRGISVMKKDNVPKMAYFGNWKKGKTNGKGMILYGEKNWYDGYWKEGHPDGFGLRQYPSGSRYLGEIKNGREHGFGSMIWSNHDMYSGYWINGKMEGEGTYTWKCMKSDGFVQPMQNTYLGHWKDGKRHGQGRLLLASGAVIDTKWENGFKEGPGQIICKNGFVIESSHLFKNDKVYQLDSPVMIPFWNTWYCEFLTDYRSGLFYIQKLEEDISENKEEKKVGEKTPKSSNQCSNNIPIMAPVESLPLWDFVLKSVCQPIPDLTGEISYLIRADDVELLSFEEMWLRKVITNRMADITCLYQHYATIVCEKKPPFKACMFRFMLCQMCRDSGLDETDFNLCELDVEAGYDSYPFAMILLFQVIHYLLVLARELCVKKRKANLNIPGRWGGAFDYFLTHYALPGMQKTNQMAELCNKIPLKHVFILYETIGVPVTVGKILNYFFYEPIGGQTIEKPVIKISRKMNGQNKIYPDGRIVYEKPNGTLLGAMFDLEEDLSKYFDLNDIKLIGKMELTWNLYEICPKAKKNNFPNSQYEVSYLEFCEFVKICLKKYKAIINPDSEIATVKKLAMCDECDKLVEIDRHYEVENENTENKSQNEISEESTTMSEDTDDTASAKTCNGSGTSSTSSVEDPQDSKIPEQKICPCMDSELVNNDGSVHKICKCESSCECSCHQLEIVSDDSKSYRIVEIKDDKTDERSSMSSKAPFKDAKTITLTPCDSDCICFCHKKRRKDIQEDFKDEDIDLEETKLIDYFEEDADSASTIKLSDAINYVCERTNGEEDIKEIEKSSSEGERISDPIDYLCSELDLDAENEFDDEEDKDSLLTGEDVMDTTNKFLLEVQKIERERDNKRPQNVFQKLQEFNCPKFKIKYKKIFSKIRPKGMTPKELKEKLDLENSEDEFEKQTVEDIEKKLIKESMKVVGIVSKQRLYEKLIMKQFKTTISQMESGEYWENFLEPDECQCICKKCRVGDCQNAKKKKKYAVGDEEFELSSDSSVTIA